MKNTSKLLVNLLIAASLSALALPSFAQGMGGGMGGMGRDSCSQMSNGGSFKEKRAERMQQRHQQLHASLKLNVDQESGWKKYADSMQPPACPEGKTDDLSKLTAPERADKMLEFSKKQQERMTEHVGALKTFYATLSPEQKKTFDNFHSGPRGGRRGPPQDVPASKQ